MAKVKENALWILIGDFLGRGMSFLASVYLARTLGAEYYGLIIFAISILGYANWFSDMGLYQIGSREKAKPPEKRIYRIKEIFDLRVILGIGITLLSVLVIYMVEIEMTQKKVLLGFMISLIPYMFLMEWFYAGKQEFGKITLSKVIQGTLYLVSITLMVKSVEDIQLVPLIYAAAVMTASVTLGILALRDNPFSLPSRGKQIYFDLFKSSSFIGLGQLSTQVIQLLPPILIGLFMTFEMAGIYGVAFKVVILAMIIDRVFSQLLLPKLSSEWVKSKQVSNTKVPMIYRIIIVLGAITALFTALGSDQIILWLFGSEYLDSIYLLKILSFFIGLTFINSLFSFSLIATNHDSQFFKATVYGGSISAVLLITASYFGNLTVIAVSVVLSEFIITTFTYFEFRKVFQFNYLKPFIMVLSLSILIYLLSLFVSIPSLLSALLGSATLLILSIWLRVLTEKDIAWIKARMTE